ncbi:MAG: hypothetical protein MMC23_000788 [Stictis urceolatum]|nr:hypothetical protein [Stictis urceolata]
MSDVRYAFGNDAPRAPLKVKQIHLPQDLVLKIADYTDKADLPAFVRVNRSFQACGTPRLYESFVRISAMKTALSTSLLLRSVPESPYLGTLIKEVEVRSANVYSFEEARTDHWIFAEAATWQKSCNFSIASLTSIEKLIHSLSRMNETKHVGHAGVRWTVAFEFRSFSPLLALLLMNTPRLRNLSISDGGYYDRSESIALLGDLVNSLRLDGGELPWPHLERYSASWCNGKPDLDQLMALLSLSSISGISGLVGSGHTPQKLESLQRASLKAVSLKKLHITSPDASFDFLAIILPATPCLTDFQFGVYDENLNSPASDVFCFDTLCGYLMPLERSLVILAIELRFDSGCRPDCKGKMRGLDKFEKLKVLYIPLIGLLGPDYDEPPLPSFPAMSRSLKKLNLLVDDCAFINSVTHHTHIFTILYEFICYIDTLAPNLRDLHFIDYRADRWDEPKDKDNFCRACDSVVRLDWDIWR